MGVFGPETEDVRGEWRHCTVRNSDIIDDDDDIY
jgi:hypothetical protein